MKLIKLIYKFVAYLLITIVCVITLIVIVLVNLSTYVFWSVYAISNWMLSLTL